MHLAETKEVVEVLLANGAEINAKDKEEGWTPLHLAAKMGCSFVRVFGYEVAPGENRSMALQRIGRRLEVLGEKAAEIGVQLLLRLAY